jgi:chromosome segregation ATPase
MEKLQRAKVSIETKASTLSTSLEQSQRSIEDLEHQLKLTVMRNHGEPLKKAREENHAHLKTIAELQMKLEQLQNERNCHEESAKAKDEALQEIQVAKQDLETRMEKLERSKKELEGHVSTLLAKLRISEHNTSELKQRLVIVSKSKEEQDRTQTAIITELEATIQQKNDLDIRYKEALQELEKFTTEVEVKELANHQKEAQALRGQLTVVTQREEEERRIRIHSEATIKALEQEIEVLRKQKLEIQSSEGAAAAKLQVVRERNEEASQLIVTLAHQAKSSAEQRDQMIRKLKERLIQVSEQKEAEISALRARLQDWERSLVRNDEF